MMFCSVQCIYSVFLFSDKQYRQTFNEVFSISLL